MANPRKRAALTATCEDSPKAVKRSRCGTLRSGCRKLSDSTIQPVYRPLSPQSAPDIFTDTSLPQEESCRPTRKRKLDHDIDWPEPPDRSRKKGRSYGISRNPPTAILDHTHEDPGCDWKEFFGQWPLAIPRDHSKMSDPRANKRSRSRTSYTQSVRDGDSPVAWTRQHEEKMQKAGLVMTDYQHRAEITEDDRRLCDELLKKHYLLPEGPSFKAERLAKVLERVRFRNEARVSRDITPIVAPSPELLTVDGYASLDDIGEAINAEWTQCDTLCGPRPKPDFVVGISSSAFAEEETEKMKLSHTSACPNLFPESLYFPFLICEVKGDRSIQEAERQAMHSASIAVRAVIELYKKVSLVHEIERKILVFSIAHDNSNMKIFGHFAKIDGDKITFFRHRLFSGDFAAELSSDEWTKAYQITRAIYELFYPKHLARIKHALAKMRGSTLASFTSQLGLGDDSQESAAESSSQEDRRFKKPPLPSVVKLQHENEKLRDQLLQSIHDHQAESHRQREEQRESREMMERQLAQQKNESQEQKKMMERQIVQQEEKSQEQKKIMELQLAQQEEKMREQREMMERQLAQQREMMERQLAQQKETMERQLAQQKEESREQKEHLQEIIQLLKDKQKAM